MARTETWEVGQNVRSTSAAALGVTLVAVRRGPACAGPRGPSHVGPVF